MSAHDVLVALIAVSGFGLAEVAVIAIYLIAKSSRELARVNRQAAEYERGR